MCTHRRQSGSRTVQKGATALRMMPMIHNVLGNTSCQRRAVTGFWVRMKMAHASSGSPQLAVHFPPLPPLRVTTDEPVTGAHAGGEGLVKSRGLPTSRVRHHTGAGPGALRDVGQAACGPGGTRAPHTHYFYGRHGGGRTRVSRFGPLKAASILRYAGRLPLGVGLMPRLRRGAHNK